MRKTGHPFTSNISKFLATTLTVVSLLDALIENKGIISSKPSLLTDRLECHSNLNSFKDHTRCFLNIANLRVPLLRLNYRNITTYSLKNYHLICITL